MQPDQPQIAVDPNLAAEQQQANQDQIKGLQTQASGDTAALMSRFGARLALSSSGVPFPAAPVAGALPAGGR